MNTPLDYSNQDRSLAQAQAGFFSKVYGWMTLALVVTGITAMFVAATPAVSALIFSSKLLFYGLFAAEFGLVWWLSSRVMTMSRTTAMSAFILYSFLNGLTISFIFFVYTSSSIASTFLVTAGTFAAMSAYGYYTKRDLTKLGSLLFMALIGLILASVVNIFMNNSTMHWIITYAGVLIFVGLTAYDTQKLKAIASEVTPGSDMEHKGAILGALSLYLDFINLFLYLLRILGSRD